MSGIAPDKTPATEDLPAAGSVASGNEVSVSQAGTMVRATLGQIVALAEGGSTAIADLSAVSSVSGTDLMRVSQSGTERKATLTEVLALAEGGAETVVDSDVGGSGTSTTSNVAGDTAIALPLEIGTYRLEASGVYVTSSGGAALKFAGAAADGLEVSGFALHLLAQAGSAGTSLVGGQTLALGTLTNNTAGATVDSAFTLTGHVKVTTGGTLKLQIASAINTFSVTMKDCIMTATKVA